MRKFLLYISVLAVVVSTSCNNQLRRIEKSNNFEKKLDYANQLFQKKKYNTAITLYTDLVQVYKGTEKFEPMYYNFAYCSYYVKDYVQAAFQFKNYLDLFPNSPRAVEIDYMQAYCYYKQSPKVSLDQTNTMKAIAAMQTFINNYPTADKVSEANLVIELCRRKLEKKEFSSAELYYNLGFFKAAGIAFKNLMRNYPDSDKSDSYKVMAIRSYYNYAKNSIPERQKERYATVLDEYLDFADHYPNSKLKPDAEKFYTLAQNNIKTLDNEQIKAKSNQ
ncbi:Beta-barrel assembly machine subunit BamD [Chitinophaga ginsengisegetis]|uniref:Beta-barrel assembly machine subunit BamD n=1 Tax=Chitinophaga ginsengisegetis TaxID=393003 RepID=A0A1T5NLI8_9BACT|nr:outer membrane protein assembly factor BamD [Chitinophaga ginsengisegetis]MDR6565321.1 outer membrane protein assembly factor BamD [Chitinophaga ginsengisegetis]MDR6645048.1 outer membrane protein assembly factor BamD [Chitinophaga ginsengisegetis]MDR6652360.1 outer membrane protein assembly factor BamD [Chitinophaga ginsengisegetis]SKD01490.1 Beta-barrel assembly machine subunit BamD [Chitinophaga ginsengisegetis]